MIETIEKTWNAGLRMLDSMPPWLAAFIVGWVASIGITHAFKYMLPVRWWAEIREGLTRAMAVLAAMVPAAIYYAEQPGTSLTGLMLVMVITGAWSPLAYALAMAWLRRSEKRAWIADVLSGDKRGVLAAKLRGEP